MRASLLLVSRGEGSHCTLCTAARGSLKWALRGFQLVTGRSIPLQEVDIDQPDQGDLRDRFCNDIPVLLARWGSGKELELFRHRMGGAEVLRALLKLYREK